MKQTRTSTPRTGSDKNDLQINRSLMKLNLNEAIPEAQTARTIIKPIQNKTSKLRAARIADSAL